MSTIKTYFNDTIEMKKKMNEIRENVELETKKRTKGAYENFVICAEEKNIIVGGCSGIIVHKNLHIRWIWVSEKYRKNGYGRLLTSEAENIAKNRGCTFVTLQTIHNHTADKFYEALGYSIEFKKRGLKSNEVYEIYYRKVL